MGHGGHRERAHADDHYLDDGRERQGRSAERGVRTDSPFEGRGSWRQGPRGGERQWARVAGVA